MSKIGLIAAIVVILALLVNAARTEPKAVCHALTEDSVITDCDYHNGAWWTK